jgi:hypothetical protein
MNKDEVIEHLCQTVSLVYNSIGDYSEPSDGFCARCPNHASPYFRHSGNTLRYVRDAVVAKLKADGIAIDSGFDPVTGDEVIYPDTEGLANHE